jgi:hypothetical protein
MPVPAAAALRSRIDAYYASFKGPGRDDILSAATNQLVSELYRDHADAPAVLVLLSELHLCRWQAAESNPDFADTELAAAATLTDRLGTIAPELRVGVLAQAFDTIDAVVAGRASEVRRIGARSPASSTRVSRCTRSSGICSTPTRAPCAPATSNSRQNRRGA